MNSKTARQPGSTSAESGDLRGTWTFVGLAMPPAPSRGGGEFMHELGRPDGRNLTNFVAMLTEANADSPLILLAENAPHRRVLLGFRSGEQAINSVVRLLANENLIVEGNVPGAGISLGEGPDDIPLTDCLAARKALALAQLSQPGQALLSAAAFESLRDSASGDFEFADLGTVHLDLQLRRERVAQLIHPRLPACRIPLETEEHAPLILPHQYGFLVGRREERDDVLGRVSRLRIVTIVGAGGMGKSHVASRVALDYSATRQEEVVWVDLAGIEHPEHFYEAVAAALGIGQTPPLSLEQTLLRQLANRRALVVLDGCERCRPTVAAFVQAVLKAPGPHFLVTSSQRLGIPKESVLLLEPLELPDRDFRPTTEDLEDQDATALFMDRARQVDESFLVSDNEALAVWRICIQLEGNPLAIVLAARRVKRRRPDEILLELNKILRTNRQKGAKVNTPVRHRAPSAALTWSFGALSPEAQDLLRALFPLRNRWTRLDAAAMGDRMNVFDQLEELIDSGFVVSEAGIGPDEYYRVPTQVAALVAARLVTPEQREEILDRHCLVMIGKLADAIPHMSGSDAAFHLDRLEAFRLDLAAAFEHTLRPRGHPKTFVEAMALSWSYWYKRNRIDEGLRLIDRALRRFSDPNSIDLGRILNVGAVLATKAGQTTRARTYLRRAVKIGRAAEHSVLLGASWGNIGIARWADGDPAGALEAYLEAYTFLQATPNHPLLGPLYNSWATALTDLSRPDEAKRVLDLAKQHFAGSKDHLDRWIQVITMGLIELGLGNWRGSAHASQEAAGIAVEMGDQASLARSLVWLAEASLRGGGTRHAACLLGAAQSAGYMSGIQLYRVNELRLASLEGRIRALLGDHEFTAAKLEGGLTSLESLLDSVAYN